MQFINLVLYTCGMFEVWIVRCSGSSATEAGVENIQKAWGWCFLGAWVSFLNSLWDFCVLRSINVMLVCFSFSMIWCYSCSLILDLFLVFCEFATFVIELLTGKGYAWSLDISCMSRRKALSSKLIHTLPVVSFIIYVFLSLSSTSRLSPLTLVPALEFHCHVSLKKHELHDPFSSNGNENLRPHSFSMPA